MYKKIPENWSILLLYVLKINFIWRPNYFTRASVEDFLRIWIRLKTGVWDPFTALKFRLGSKEFLYELFDLKVKFVKPQTVLLSKKSCEHNKKSVCKRYLPFYFLAQILSAWKNVFELYFHIHIAYSLPK